MNKSVLTKKAFRFQKFLGKARIPGLCTRRRMKDLRKFARRVWDREGGKLPFPEIVAHEGGYDGVTAMSYSCGGRVELARPHRTHEVLLHELAHELTQYSKLDHGPAFWNRYLQLLADYGYPEALGVAL